MRTSSILSSLLFAATALGGVAPAPIYRSPYTPTKCPNTPFPSNGYFVAAGDGIWDNGGACGRSWLIRCVSGKGNPCRGARGKSPEIQVMVVDYRPGAQFTLNTAVNAALQTGVGVIHIEWVQVEFKGWIDIQHGWTVGLRYRWRNWKVLMVRVF